MFRTASIIMTYAPQPLDMSAIELGKPLEALLEQVAAHLHDAWSRQRIAEGWTWGPQRDDQRREHPCLVEYAKLPESEKEYDRIAARETLKAILALGYRIAPDGAGSEDGEDVSESLPSGAPPQSRAAAKRPPESGTAALLALNHYRSNAKELLASGEPLLAYDAATTGLRSRPADAELQQSLALAMIRSGAPLKGTGVLKKLRKRGLRDEETLGILAGGYKTLYLQAPSSSERDKYLRLAATAYAETYRHTRGIWPGINVALFATLRREHDEARRVAEEVYASCLAQVESSPAGPDLTRKALEERYWLLATLGQAALILNRRDDAERWYKAASSVAGKNWGNVATTRRDARSLLDVLGGDRRAIEESFVLPRIVVFAGHMIDRPGRTLPRFPASIEGDVRRAIRSQLDTLGPLIGYASATCGADMIFLEEVLERGDDAHVVLPYDRAEFVKDCVAIVPNGDWPARFDRALERARSVREISAHKVPLGSLSYDYANQVLLGLAKSHAKRLGTELAGLVAWNGRPGDGPGGTASIAERLQSLGVSLQRIAIERLLESSGIVANVDRAPIKMRARTRSRSPSTPRTAIKAVLFADVRGFSKLPESEIPLFVDQVLGTAARLIHASAVKPMFKNTWGDALYLVFDTTQDAGCFALDLKDRLDAIDWTAIGFSQALSMRMSLHAGPVYRLVDPLIRKWTYAGTHVSRAARIEPVTPPGEVYASEAFAALSALTDGAPFVCEYVGNTALAKSYGSLPLYHVRRSTGAAVA